MAARYILRNNSTGAETELRPSMVVGKLDTCDIVLKQGLPSRRHALLVIENDTLYVNDEGSSNGTFVNGVRITARTALKSGDKLRFDVEEYTVGGPPAVGSDDGKTVIRRPPPEPVASPAPSASAGSSAPAAAAREEKRPPAWIDAAEHAGGGGSKTVYFDRKGLHEQVTADGSAGSQDTPRVGVPTLLIKSGSAAGRRFELRAAPGAAQEWTVGSDPNAAIALADPGVSTLHASISCESGRWKVADKMSANGTFVNGNSSTLRYLASGDRVRFGATEALFLLPVGSSSPDHPATGGDGARGRRRTVVIAVGAFLVTMVLILVAYKLFGPGG